MDEAIKTYLDRAAEILGERTESQILYDETVVEALNQGRTIKEALSIAGKDHPEEALEWDNDNIKDIATHYDYLKEHAKIMEILKKQRTR